MQRVYCVLTCIFSALILYHLPGPAYAAPAGGDRSPVSIGFHFYKPGTIYEEAYLGVVDGLRLADMVFDQVVYRSGRDQALARENLRALDRMGLDAIVSFSSAGTRIAHSLSLETPLLASVINHPISLGIESEDSSQRPQISGTSYYVDASQQLDLYLELFPGMDRVAMVYDRNNPAGYLAEEPMMRSACEKRGLVFHAAAATGRGDVAAAAMQLVTWKADLVVIPTNLQIYNNLDLILAVTTPAGIPVVSMNKQGVEAGALAALYADTYKNGRQMIAIIRQIVAQKKNAADIPFYYTDSPDLIINLQAAAALDYEFHPGVLGRASIVLN